MAITNITQQKFKQIQDITRRDNNLLNISWLCEISEVSRSGYYNWLKGEQKRKDCEQRDRKDFQLVLEAYSLRGYNAGSRGIHMRLLHMGILMNRKKNQRLMRKYHLDCKIRKPNPYKKMAKAQKENMTKPNLLNRQFTAFGPRTVFLTDISYFFYGKGKRAYLSTIKDAFTNQILSHTLSESLEIDFVLEMIHLLMSRVEISIKQDTLIHSDQGVHYTSISFQKLVSDLGLRQSMSRRGNCWDNAPQESFFGHMKDEIGDLSQISSFDALREKCDDYIDFYNSQRPQWHLAKLSPNQYEEFFKTGVYPLAHMGLKAALPKTRSLNKHLLEQDEKKSDVPIFSSDKG